jgi:hypothetical protein
MVFTQKKLCQAPKFGFHDESLHFYLILSYICMVYRRAKPHTVGQYIRALFFAFITVNIWSDSKRLEDPTDRKLEED